MHVLLHLLLSRAWFQIEGDTHVLEAVKGVSEAAQLCEVTDKKLKATFVVLGLVGEVSSVKCHFATIVMICMRQFEDTCHNSMH